MTREEAIEVLKKIASYEDILEYLENHSVTVQDACYMAIKALEQEPKTGRWIKSSIGGAKICSICQAHMGLSSFKFCPNCGAEMIGDTE